MQRKNEGVKNRFKNIQTNSFFVYPDQATVSNGMYVADRQIAFTYRDFQLVRDHFKAGLQTITSRTNPVERIKEIKTFTKQTTCHFAAVDHLAIRTNLKSQAKGCLPGEESTVRDF